MGSILSMPLMILEIDTIYDDDEVMFAGMWHVASLIQPQYYLWRYSCGMCIC